MPPTPVFAALAAMLLVGACGTPDRPSAATCGISMLAGPTMLLSEFAVPGQTLATPPARLPEQIVARLVAGPAYRAIVGRSDSLVIVGVDGTIPAGIKPGFGTLIVDPEGSARGVLLFEGPPIENAPHIGTVSIGNTSVPLLGIQLDLARIEDARCPFFPDSLIR
jgi:hypothetical protein